MKYVRSMKIGILILSVCLFTLPGLAQNLKIGYLNSQEILSTHQEFIDAQKKIENLQRQWENEIVKMQNELQQMYEQFESQSLLLSESKKAEKQLEIQNLDVRMKQFYQEKLTPGQGELYQRQEQLMKPIHEKINTAIEKIGDEGKYDLIYDEVVGNILYTNKQTRLDLTTKLLGELKKSTPIKK